MTKHLCWICDKEIISHNEYEQRNLMPGIQVEEICYKCGKKVADFIKQLKGEEK